MKVIEEVGTQETLNSLKARAQRINDNGVIIKPFVYLVFPFFQLCYRQQQIESALDWKYTKCVPDWPG